MTSASPGVRAKARTIAYSPRVPFELRCRLFYWNRRRSWSTREPVTFNQKLLRKIALDRRPLLTTFADKVAVRDYVADAVGPDVLPHLHAVVDDPAELDPAQLPAQFVVKPTHASGMIWIVSDRSSPRESASDNSTHTMFATTPDELDWDMLRAACRKWLAVNYANVEQEWAYGHVPPRIMVEELLEGADGQSPPDYKFFVFHGRARLVQVDTDRFSGHHRNFFRPDWTPVDARLIYPPAEHAPPRPDGLEEMVHVAEALGKDTDFVRVDLYDVAGRVVFGELTSTPEGARQAFSPESFEVELGRYWNIPRRYA
jgi:hypothetical protein